MFHFKFVNDIENFSILSYATVHNLFIELYSDLGIITFLVFLIVLYKIYKKLGEIHNHVFEILKVSFLTFIINYNLEPNYVHFFFWFFMFFYVFSIKNWNLNSLKS